MTEFKDEAALRAILQLVERPPQPRLITARVLFHPDDWRAFIRGLEATFRSEIHLFDEDRMQLPVGTLWEGMDRYKELDLLVVDPLFDVKKTPGKTYAIKDLAALEAEVYFDRGPLRPLRMRDDSWADWLKATVIHGLHHKSDDGKRRFLQAVKRVVAKMSTNRVRLIDHETGRIDSEDWKGAPVRFGFAALKWRAEGDRRFMDYGGAPQPDWTFPEDHPWYQDEP